MPDNKWTYGGEGFTPTEYNPWLAQGISKQIEASRVKPRVLSWNRRDVPPWIEQFNLPRTALTSAPAVVNAVAANVGASTVAPKFRWYVPGEVLQDLATGKFYDASGQAEISPEDVEAIRQLYQYELGSPFRKQTEADWADYKTRMAAWSQQMEAAARASTQRGMEDIRPLLEEAFEAGRTARVSGLTGYGDWIKRWDAIHQVNPYTVPQSEKIGQRISQLEAELALDETKAAAINPQLQRAREDAYGIAWAEQERFLREGARPATPPAPGWLPEFVPGLKAGQPISRQSIPTPSGQQLTRMPWSQAQGLAGYAEWAGGSPWRDILEQAQMMQPFTPNIASRWQPAKQRR